MPTPFAYDVIDYPPMVHPQMHPSRLAAIGRLHGVAAASPGDCHLLEVGCGDGLQLLTLAMAYPRARFVGVDLSAAAIARGEAMRMHLGLDNLQLVAADLLDWNAGMQPFDYILAHGFYSWVPPAVRDRLLALCGRHLAPAGLAYVSYNTLPGGHLRRMLWEVMKFHSAGAESPEARIASARECLELLSLGLPTTDNRSDDTRYASAMRGEISDLLARWNPSVLFHDDLAELNEPVTLDRFVGEAREHGLEFVAEASYHEMSPRFANAEARNLLEEIGREDLVTKEQYLDFFTGRRFRQSILCRAAAQPRALPDPSTIAGMELVSRLSREPDQPDPDGLVRYSQQPSGGLATRDPVLQELLDRCAELHPLPRPVSELLDQARAATNSAKSRQDDTQAALRLLLSAFQTGVVELHCDAPRFATRASDRPIASPLARLQAQARLARAATLRPAMIDLDDPVLCDLLVALDGTRDRSALRLHVDGLADGDVLEAALARIAKLGLLCAEPAEAQDQRTM